MLFTLTQRGQKSPLSRILCLAFCFGGTFSIAQAAAITDTEWNNKTTAEKFAYALDNYNDLTLNQKKWVQQKARVFLPINNSDKDLNKTNIFVSTGSYSSYKIGNNTPYVVIGENSAGGEQGFAIGKQALAIGRTSIAQGYQASAFNDSSIAIGSNANALPLIHPLASQVIGGPASGSSDSGLALGNLTTVTGNAIGIGGGSTSLGFQGVAIGAGSAIIAPGLEKYIPGSAQIAQNGDVWVDYLVEKGLYKDSYNGLHDYDGNGTLEPLNDEDQAKWNAIDTAIKQAYQPYLNYVQYDQLKASDSNRADQIMSALRYQYVMEIENRQPWNGTALGAQAITNVVGGVALGASSVADRGGFDQDTIAPYSNANLAGQTTGAISVGGRPFVYQQDQYGAITGVTRGPQILRQLINLADGTEETDAVNLRQLTAAINSVRNTGGGGDGAAVVVTPVVVTPGDSNIIIGGPDSTTSNGQTVHTYSIKLAPNLTADSFSVNNGPSMTTEGINANNQRISNVAPGRAGTTDAVNMQQLGALQSNVNTLQSNVNRIEHSVRKIRKEMRSIGANSTAIASLPQVMHAGKSQIAMATGVYRDASSVAIGWSHANEKGNTVFKLNGAISSNGDATAGVGFGYEY